jgi:7-keto-8-aminopelargonate synthetase-like enzyme
LIDFLVNRARSFIFSTAPVPAAAAAATAGVRLIQSGEGKKRCTRLWRYIQQVGDGVRSLKPSSAVSQRLLTSSPTEEKGAIIPIIVGDETKAVEVAMKLREQGIFVPAIRHPTVARGQARLRVTLTATHTTEEINLFAAILNEIVNRKS